MKELAGVRMGKEWHEKLKKYCDENGLKMSFMNEQAIKELLAKKELEKEDEKKQK